MVLYRIYGGFSVWDTYCTGIECIIHVLCMCKYWSQDNRVPHLIVSCHLFHPRSVNGFDVNHAILKQGKHFKHKSPYDSISGKRVLTYWEILWKWGKAWLQPDEWLHGRHGIVILWWLLTWNSVLGSFIISTGKKKIVHIGYSAHNLKDWNCLAWCDSCGWCLALNDGDCFIDLSHGNTDGKTIIACCPIVF